jgi:serine/threonine-protein kinase HipA
MTARETLTVWLYGTQVAHLSETHDGDLALTWTRDAYDRWGDRSRVLSQLLPISLPSSSPHSQRVTTFIDGLLPEGNARVNYAIDVGLTSEDTFGMISRYGRDTAGALVFQPPNEPEPTRVGYYTPVTDEEVGQRLLDADRHAPTDPSERGVDSISLAGMQPKIGLHRTDQGWQACRGGAPSTWIVKLAHPLGSIAADVVDTEVLSLDLARNIDLTTVTAEIHDFGGVRAIAVRRYDRYQTTDGATVRIHQEDIAQALGLNTNDPNRKFQRGNAMPSLALAAGVLRDGGAEPDDLLRLITFNHLVGNTDAHAKNISLIRHPDGTADLAPAYDVAMHMHHRLRDPLSAMDVNGKFRMLNISIDDVIAEGQSWALPHSRASRLVAATTNALSAALDEIDLADYPGVSNDAFATVRGRVAGALRDLTAGLSEASSNQSGRQSSASADISGAGQVGRGFPATPPTPRRGPHRSR